MAPHTITVTSTVRRLGRVRITDWFWSCTCGTTTTAPLGHSTRRNAELDGSTHRDDPRHGRR